ncbi:GNAT family N-acetyltransferase [Micrococcus terreus]|uniref:GNAT family N-acetyltransferase n=1 Tax=Micrococcus terreus TaxID=574650 RepID=UPI0023F850F4|nr:GNAT family protein [Micrococcus terreus]
MRIGIGDLDHAAPPPPVPLCTDRLVLRYVREDDAEGLRRYYGREDVTRFLLDGPWDAEHAAEQARYRSGRKHITQAGFATVLVAELAQGADGDDAGRLVGDISLWAVDDSLSHGEVSWVMDPDLGGQGYATEMARAVLGLGFGHYGMHRIQAQVESRNGASARLCERLGMRQEAHLRRNWRIKGEWTDTLVYGLLAEEFAASDS